MADGVLVDANVLLDILTADPQWLAWSFAELRRAKAGPVSSPWPASSAACQCARFDEGGNQDQLAAQQGWSAFGAGADALAAPSFPN